MAKLKDKSVPIYASGAPYWVTYSPVVRGDLSSVEKQIYDLLRRRKVKGFTCEEVEERLGLKHQTASARIYDLRRYGLVTAAGPSQTSAGRPATAWKVAA